MDVTTSPAPPSRGREQTRRRLVESATRLFAERGLHGVTSHDIARGAGMAAGTFYLHFRDKTEAYRHIVFEAVEGLVGEIEAAVASADGSPATAERTRAETIVRFAKRNRDLIRILFSSDAESAAVEADVLAKLADGLEERLRWERDEGLFPADLDPAVCARAHVGLTAHLIDWWTQDPSRATEHAIVETLVRLQFSPSPNDRSQE